MILLLFLIFTNIQSQSHLSPEDSPFGFQNDFYDYYNIVSQQYYSKLSGSPIVAMICIPAFQKEWAVFIVRKNETDTMIVYLIQSKENIYNKLHRLEEKNIIYDPHQNYTLVYKKVIDIKDANSIREVLYKMTLNTRYENRSTGGLDGTIYHFEVVGEYGRRAGKVYEAYESTATGQMVRICNILSKYTTSEESKKEKILVSLRKMVKHLNDGLK